MIYRRGKGTGYIDRAEKWLSPGGLLDRLNFCIALVRNQVNGVNVNVDRLTSKRTPEELAKRIVLDGEISDTTRTALVASMAAMKPDYAQVVGMLLGSPEFQRR